MQKIHLCEDGSKLVLPDHVILMELSIQHIWSAGERWQKKLGIKSHSRNEGEANQRTKTDAGN
jgi:hypothetical protein